MPERRHRIAVAMSDGPDAVLAWKSRALLLERLPANEMGGAIQAAFSAVGASRPVELDYMAKAELLAVIDVWLIEVGMEGAPPDIVQLRGSLRIDLTEEEHRLTNT